MSFDHLDIGKDFCMHNAVFLIICAGLRSLIQI